MSKTPRGNVLSKSLLDNPAPGSYNISPKKGGPQYSFAKSTKKELKNETPGVGNYNGDFNSIKNKTMSAHFGETKRRDVVPTSARDQPGPGAYGAKPLNKGPSYTLQERRDMKKREQNAGPG